MATYPNFYETVAEATMRLRHTLVMYDNEPYTVIAVCDALHFNDGIFRLYLEAYSPSSPSIMNPTEQSDLESPYHKVSTDSPDFHKRMDAWLEKQTKFKIIRRTMNSPAFNKFRPFPLGMVNSKGHLYYIERAPKRKSEQGLLRSQCISSEIIIPQNGSMDETSAPKVDNSTVWSAKGFVDMLKGQYPTIDECFEKLKTPVCLNVGAAWCRKFGLVRGPANTLFLGSGVGIIGMFPDNNPSRLYLSEDYVWMKESILEESSLKHTAITVR